MHEVRNALVEKECFMSRVARKEIKSQIKPAQKIREGKGKEGEGREGKGKENKRREKQRRDIKEEKRK